MSRLPKLSQIKSVSSVLVTDHDHTVFAISHPKHLSLFTSPLAGIENNEEQQLSDPHAKPLQGLRDDTYALASSPNHGAEFQDPKEPLLKRSRESGVIQLFYDLFFVANLTTFTRVHEINNVYALGSYITFFFALWGTWLQVASFDLRFGNDSIFERVCKALQFGIMTGLTIVGPAAATQITQDGEGIDLKLQGLRSMALVFMASRLVLACQYIVVMVSLRRFVRARSALIMYSGTLFAVAMVFLGVSFIFNREGAVKVGATVFYPIILFEFAIMCVISCRAHFMDLRNTIIVERLGLLTLIILGEGVIGLCTAISRVDVDFSFSADVIGMIVCAILIIYFIWMLYFDQTETEHVGTIRQQIWVGCHFPFHVAVLLTLEGVSQFSVWRKVVDLVLPYVTSMENYPMDLHGSNLSAYLNDTVTALYSRFPQSTIEHVDLGSYFQLISDPSANNISKFEAGYNITAAGVVFVCKNFGIEPPEDTSPGGETNPAELYYGVYDRETVVYVYFFIAAGTTLLMLALLMFLGKREKVRGDYISVTVRVLIGLGISFLALMALPANNFTTDIGNFIFSPWMLPSVTLSYGLVVLIDNLIVRYIHSVVLHHKNEQIQLLPESTSMHKPGSHAQSTNEFGGCQPV